MRIRKSRTSTKTSRTRKSRIKTTLTTPRIGIVRRSNTKSTKISRKDVNNLKTENIIKDIENEDDVKLNCMSNIRNRAQRAMKRKNLTEKDIRKFLGLKKYEN